MGLIIKCRDCGCKTGNNTERCGPCRIEFNKRVAMQGQEVIYHKYGKVSDECVCKECGETALTIKMGKCNTCLSKEDTDDVINWPKHYNAGKIQPIDVIEDWNLDFRLASALKYIARAGKKDPMKTNEDLTKAIWYIQRYIDKGIK